MYADVSLGLVHWAHFGEPVARWVAGQSAPLGRVGSAGQGSGALWGGPWQTGHSASSSEYRTDGGAYRNSQRTAQAARDPLEHACEAQVPTVEPAAEFEAVSTLAAIL